jgi:hypothetical protein
VFSDLLPSNNLFVAIRSSGNMTTKLPLSNGLFHHIVLPLRLIVPNSLSVYHCSFFSEVSARDGFLWFGLSRIDHSPTTTTTPSLRPLVPSNSLKRFQSIQVQHHHPKFSFPTVGAKLSRVTGAPTFLAHLTLTLLVGTPSFSEGADPSTTSNP